MTDLDRYRSLFIHRSDVFAAQQPSGAYFPVQREFDDVDLDEHLAGLASYGTYVVCPGVNTIKYLVFDLDIHDGLARVTLCSLVEKMVRLNMSHDDYARPLLLESSGSKGWHVWLFFDEPVPAEKARRWVAADFLPQWQEAARADGWPEGLEVFPKQDTVSEGGYGNLVKLPLGVHAVSGKKSSFHPYEGWPVEISGVVPFPAALVPDCRPPAQPERSRSRPSGRRGSTSNGPATPFACVDTIMRDGVGSGYRNNAMFHLALYLYGHGIDDDLAQEICLRANENFDPPFEEREVERIIKSAYTGRYEATGCGKDFLADICPGPCWSGKHVDWKPEQGALLRVEPGSNVELSVVSVSVEGGVKRVRLGHPDAVNSPTLVIQGK